MSGWDIKFDDGVSKIFKRYSSSKLNRLIFPGRPVNDKEESEFERHCVAKIAKLSSSSSGRYNTGAPSAVTASVFQRAFTLCCRQIHPLYGEKAGFLGYCDTVGNTENFPPAPNIVVEGGRIEFMRPSQDGTTTPRRNTMSRGSQTFNEQSEKSDPAKVSES